jgi:calnexin
VEEKHLKAPPAPKTDALTHLYTLVVSGTDYDILIDGSSVSKGSMTGDLFDPQVCLSLS